MSGVARPTDYLPIVRRNGKTGNTQPFGAGMFNFAREGGYANGG